MDMAYAENKVRELKEAAERSRLLGEDLENAEKFFIEFLEIMADNGMSRASCDLFAAILKDSLHQLLNFVDSKRLLRYAEIYLGIMKQKGARIPGGSPG